MTITDMWSKKNFKIKTPKKFKREIFQQKNQRKNLLSFCTDWSKFKTRKRRANILVFIFMDRVTCLIPIKYVNSFWLFQTKKGIGYSCFLLKLIVIWLFFPLDLGVDIDTVKLNTTKPRTNSNKKVHVSFWENKWYNRIKMNTVRN